MTRSETIDMIRLAIELAGDGGPTPFTEEDYREMYDFLNTLQQ